MRTIADLFGQSPIAPLQKHMDSVAVCVHKMLHMWEVLFNGTNQQAIEQLTAEVSRLEHETDQIKNEIRRNVPTRLFMAIDRSQLLKILSRQDDIADMAEDIAVLMSLHPLPIPHFLLDDLRLFLAKNAEAFEFASQTGHELNQLMASSFGGPEADKVRDLSDKCAFAEHEADILQRSLVKKLFNNSEALTHAEFFMWRELIAKLGSISDLSESLAKNIRLTLDA